MTDTPRNTPRDSPRDSTAGPPATGLSQSGDLSGISELFGLRDGQQAESGTRTGTDTVGRWVAATEGDALVPADASGRLVHGRYRLIAELGVGGMGVTYRAWDTKAGIPVVVKMPRREVRQDSEAMQRFAREIDAMLAVPHERIVPITDHGDDDGCPFVVMRFLPGGSLADYRRRDEAANAIRNPPGMLHFWLPGVAAALDHIHAKGMLHRDVKPGNIFLDGFLKPYLGDFGIAKVVDESGGLAKEQTLTATKMAVGTPEYMAPELFKPRSRPDGRVDQYALAVTVYEMLSGEKPFKGDRAHIIVEHSGLPVPPLSAKVPGLAQSLCMAVERGLAKKSEERFATCGEFAAAVVAELAVLQPEPDTVRLLCPSCKNILKLPQKAAGSTGKCPRCQTAMDVAADLGSLWLESEERGGGAVAKVQSAASPEAAAETFAEVRPRRGWGVKEWAALALAACCGLAVGYPWGVSVNAAKAQREFRETEFTWQSERANLGAAQEALAGQNRQLETEGAELRNAKEALAAERDKLREAQEAMAAGNRSLAENAKTANEARMNVARDYEQLAMRLKTLAAENGRLVEDSKAANEVRKNLASDNVELEMRLKTSVAELLARAPRPTLPDEASSAGPVPKRVTNSIGMELIRIPKGEFMMGSPTTEKNRAAPAEDQVRVTISRDFLLGKTEVTRGQWTTVMETTPWRGSGGKSNDDLPAANVSWDDARAFCWKLTVREWGSGRLAANEAYRLPTEAEWEYACRAGTTTVFSFGNEESQLGNFGWFGWSDGNSGGKAHPVGTKKPNPWGLYDMHGNEAEWCSDWFSIGLDGGVDPVGPVVPVGNEGSGRISRGGGWWHDPKDCRSARRSCSSWPADQHDYQGFRVARSQLVK